MNPSHSQQRHSQQRHSQQRWPVELTEGRVALRPLRIKDGVEWHALRQQNVAWLKPWEATRPMDTRPEMSFANMVRRLRAEARAGRSMPFAITHDGRFVGQLTVSGVTWGSLCGAHLGYWIDEGHAGQGIMPTAVAMASDHCWRIGLHRVEVCIRPENRNSRRVVEKLGFREEGLRPRFLHIDGRWRDHLIYVLTAEEVPEGLVARWRTSRPPLAAQ